MNLKEAQQKINEIKIQQMQIDEKDLDMWNDYQRQIEIIQKETIMTPWDHVELARRPDRPKAQDVMRLRIISWNAGNDSCTIQRKNS